ncbi:MAG: MFS transporter [Gammaproteobacteria bacterium]|nr:MAG: MFS transporter [Gammaproteobacteria bacterium]
MPPIGNDMSGTSWDHPSMNDQGTDIAPGVSTHSVGIAGAERLSLAVIWAYSIPRIGFGILGILFATYLMKFATDVLLIAPAVMGTLLAASRLWDGASDPLIGYLSDRTRSRFGRRRVWLFWAAIPTGLGMVMMWSPPNTLDATWLVIWMGAGLLLYETASTGFNIPHGALGVELTPNYHERTRLYGYSHMIGAIGTILGLGALHLMNIAEDKRQFAFELSLVVGALVALLILGSTRMLPERLDYQGRGGQHAVKSFLDVFRNPHARLLLIVFGVETFGAASIGLMVPYIVEYVIPMRDLMVPLLLVYIVPQFVLTPLWIVLARRYGKKNLWLLGMLGSAGAFFGLFWLEGTGPLIWIYAFGAGLAAGIGAVVAPAIQADIIDYDEYTTHERKEGAYLAVWNLVRKSAASVTALVMGISLQLAGFEPNVEQTEAAKLTMRALFGLLPAACYVIGAILFLRFRFNEAEHAEIRRAIADR